MSAARTRCPGGRHGRGRLGPQAQARGPARSIWRLPPRRGPATDRHLGGRSLSSTSASAGRAGASRRATWSWSGAATRRFAARTPTGCRACPRHPGLHISCLEWFRARDIGAIAWDMMDERPSNYPGFGMSVHLSIPFLGLALVGQRRPRAPRGRLRRARKSRVPLHGDAAAPDRGDRSPSPPDRTLLETKVHLTPRSEGLLLVSDRQRPDQPRSTIR